MSIESVKAFYERLASDEVFRTQLQAVESKEECSQIVKNAGYDFTKQEFEEYTAQLLESSSDNDGITDLNEKELEAVFGGALPIVNIDKILLADVISTYPWPRAQFVYGVVVKYDLLDNSISGLVNNT